MPHPIALILSYGLLGASLKYIDQVFDEGIFNKAIAWILAIASGILMGALTTTDPASAAILLGVVFGVAITGKLDNAAFHLVALLAVATPLIAAELGVGYISLVSVQWSILAIVILASALDEYLDKLGEKKRILFSRLRPVLKITVLCFYFSGVWGFEYFLAVMSLDLAYIAVEIQGQKIAENIRCITKKYNPLTSPTP